MARRKAKTVSRLAQMKAAKIKKKEEKFTAFTSTKSSKDKLGALSGVIDSVGRKKCLEVWHLRTGCVDENCENPDRSVEHCHSSLGADGEDEFCSVKYLDDRIEYTADGYFENNLEYSKNHSDCVDENRQHPDRSVEHCHNSFGGGNDFCSVEYFDDQMAEYVTANTMDTTDGKVHQMCCAVWSKCNSYDPYQMTLGHTSYSDPMIWAQAAKQRSIAFLRHPTVITQACRSVTFCVRNGMRLIGAIGLGIYVHEPYRRVRLKMKIKGLLRPMLNVVYKNDPEDNTECLRYVNQQIIDKVSLHVPKMPPINADAFILYLIRGKIEKTIAI